MRWLALTCALLFGIASTAQAAHLHELGAGGSKHLVQQDAAGQQGSNAEEHCPLCVAMHSALPAPIAVAPAPPTAKMAMAPSAVSRGAATAWHFARFGRPPPVVG